MIACYIICMCVYIYIYIYTQYHEVTSETCQPEEQEEEGGAGARGSGKRKEGGGGGGSAAAASSSDFLVRDEKRREDVGSIFEGWARTQKQGNQRIEVHPEYYRLHVKHTS